MPIFDILSDLVRELCFTREPVFFVTDADSDQVPKFVLQGAMIDGGQFVNRVLHRSIHAEMHFCPKLFVALVRQPRQLCVSQHGRFSLPVQ